MSKMRVIVSRVGIAGLVASFAACASAPEILDGECQDMFGADVCTWGVLQGGDVVEFGATVPMASIDGAPADAPMQFPPPLIAAVRLPEAIRTATGFDHVGINWEAGGHPPQTWMTPHFDFHVYTMTPSEIMAIDCSNLEKPAVLPEGYALPDLEIPGMGVLVGACVPGMGMHSARADEMDDTELFDATMIVGYYAQSFMSVEPMITRALFEARQNFSLDIPAVPDPGRAKMVPTSFEAEYDAEAQSYRFVFRVAAED